MYINLQFFLPQIFTRENNCCYGWSWLNVFYLFSSIEEIYLWLFFIISFHQIFSQPTKCRLVPFGHFFSSDCLLSMFEFPLHLSIHHRWYLLLSVCLLIVIILLVIVSVHQLFYVASFLWITHRLTALCQKACDTIYSNVRWYKCTAMYDVIISSSTLKVLQQ